MSWRQSRVRLPSSDVPVGSRHTSGAVGGANAQFAMLTDGNASTDGEGSALTVVHGRTNAGPTPSDNPPLPAPPLVVALLPTRLQPATKSV